MLMYIVQLLLAIYTGGVKQIVRKIEKVINKEDAEMKKHTGRYSIAGCSYVSHY